MGGEAGQPPYTESNIQGRSNLAAGADGDYRYTSKSVYRNSLIFAILMIIIQVAVCLIYGLLFYAPPQLINVSSIITTIGLAILIIAGNHSYT